MRSKNATGPLDHVFYALSDPTRRSILAFLAHEDANLTELTERSNLSFAAVAKHLRVLERGKLVRRRSDRRDGRAVVFALRTQPMQAGIDWLEKHRCYWHDRFDELDAFVASSYVPSEDDDDGTRR